MIKRSDTFGTNWTGDREYTLDPGAIPQIAANPTNPADIYCSSVVPYKGQYIGMPTMYFHPTNLVDGPVYPTLMYSRDSSKWTFEDPYKPIIDLNAHGPVNSDNSNFGQAYMMTTLPEKDGWLYMYYGYYPEQHNSVSPDASEVTYLAKLREDRFVGIQSDDSVGVWTTSEITLSDDPGRLLVNALVGGSVEVEVLDPTTMQPFAGYSLANAISIGSGDYLDASARWRGRDTLNSLAGQTVMLRFLMDDATIYSFHFVAAPEPSTITMLVVACIACLPALRRSHIRRSTLHGLMGICAGLLAIAPLAFVGCGKSATGRSLHGAVTCDGKTVPTGEISFVPIDNAAGPIRSAPIIDGQYRIAAPGGVPFGKYRIQVDAKHPTGRKVPVNNGREVTMGDETVRMGKAVYANGQSPLTAEVSADLNETYDIAIH
jgi:hypothetical protein